MARIGYATCPKCRNTYLMTGGHKCDAPDVPIVSATVTASLAHVGTSGVKDIADTTSKFDRNAYQREYMKAWRLRKREKRDE